MLMSEFLTAIKHKLPVKIVINNNNSLGQILWEQMVPGYPEHGVRYPEPFVDYTALASANGALGIKVDKADGVRTAIERGTRARRSRAGRRQRQPGRAAAAREGGIPAGKEVRRSLPARPAPQVNHCHHLSATRSSS
jgi:TPP-dependent trihydroxycyclohexane-1,2-dione (THcHDO) dehydratase